MREAAKGERGAGRAGAGSLTGAPAALFILSFIA